MEKTRQIFTMEEFQITDVDTQHSGTSNIFKFGLLVVISFHRVQHGKGVEKVNLWWRNTATLSQGQHQLWCHVVGTYLWYVMKMALYDLPPQNQ